MAKKAKNFKPYFESLWQSKKNSSFLFHNRSKTLVSRVYNSEGIFVVVVSNRFTSNWWLNEIEVGCYNVGKIEVHWVHTVIKYFLQLTFFLYQTLIRWRGLIEILIDLTRAQYRLVNYFSVRREASFLTSVTSRASSSLLFFSFLRGQSLRPRNSLARSPSQKVPLAPRVVYVKAALQWTVPNHEWILYLKVPRPRFHVYVWQS